MSVEEKHSMVAKDKEKIKRVVRSRQRTEMFDEYVRDLNDDVNVVIASIAPDFWRVSFKTR